MTDAAGRAPVSGAAGLGVRGARAMLLAATLAGPAGAETEARPVAVPNAESFAMTATLDVLQDMARGAGPERALLALGYSGWGPGQLEGEIQANGWLTGSADPELVFGSRDQDKWAAALRAQGIDPRLLSADGGRA